VVRFYNNLQERGDCQTTRKSYKTEVLVGWVVGWKKSTNSKGGVTGYLEVLTNETNAFSTELGLVQAQLNELLAGPTVPSIRRGLAAIAGD
jgi:hypothetical protein